MGLTRHEHRLYNMMHQCFFFRQVRRPALPAQKVCVVFLAPHIPFPALPTLSAALNAERGENGREDADGHLKNGFNGFSFHGLFRVFF